MLKSFRIVSLGALTILTLVLGGCRGAEGPSGIDANGVDTTPPTIQLIEPWPLTTFYDEMRISASAVDNVAVERVVFMLDGSPYVPGLTMVTSAPPYRFIIPLQQIRSGWHFVSARAYDLAGNVADAASRPVWLGLSKMLSDTTVTLSWHNGRVAQIFSAPDTTQSEAFYIRMAAARRAHIDVARLIIGGSFSDTTTLKIGVWTGISSPTTQKLAINFPAASFSGAPREQSFSFADADSVNSGEFFLVVELVGAAAGDTIKLAVDNGEPPWNRSGVRDDGGWEPFKDRYSLNYNFIGSVDLVYPTVPPDTTEG